MGPWLSLRWRLAGVAVVLAGVLGAAGDPSAVLTAEQQLDRAAAALRGDPVYAEQPADPDRLSALHALVAGERDFYVAQFPASAGQADLLAPWLCVKLRSGTFGGRPITCVVQAGDTLGVSTAQIPTTRLQADVQAAGGSLAALVTTVRQQQDASASAAASRQSALEHPPATAHHEFRPPPPDPALVSTDEGLPEALVAGAAAIAAAAVLAVFARRRSRGRDRGGRHR